MTKEYSLISFKPDAYRRKMTKTILKAFKTEGLKPVYHKKLWLTEDMILDYQPVTKKMPPMMQKMFIYTYMAHETDIYLMQGPDATRKTNEIKRNLRNAYVKGNPQETPFNLFHSSDNKPDLMRNVRVLMPEKLALIKKAMPNISEISEDDPSFIPYQPTSLSYKVSYSYKKI